MRWNKINDHWECVFVNVPFKVILVDKVEFIKATLLFTHDDFWVREIGSKTYSSVELAKSEVHLFIIQQLAEYSNTVQEEYTKEQVMTWRKLKQQLDEIPEEQLDDLVRVLDSDGDWAGEPEIIKASQDMYKDCELGHDCTLSHGTDDVLIVVKGNYYLSIEL